MRANEGRIQPGSLAQLSVRVDEFFPITSLWIRVQISVALVFNQDEHFL